MYVSPSVPLQAEAPQTPRSGGRAPVIGWAAALAMFPLFAFVLLPPFRRTHGGNAEVDAVFWAFFAVAVRAAVALVLRNRSRWWLLYIALYFLLPIVAAVASECWRRTH